MLTVLGTQRAMVESVATVEIPFVEKELAERARKAFAYAITLCSKKSRSNLFTNSKVEHMITL